jgi:hypothetical protein
MSARIKQLAAQTNSGMQPKSNNIWQTTNHPKPETMLPHPN